MNKKIISVLTILLLSIIIATPASAYQRDVGVIAESNTQSIDFNHPPAFVRFTVSIFNLGCETETGISLIIQQPRTGKTLYYNPVQVESLLSWTQRVFVIDIPVSDLDVPPAGNRWVVEYFDFYAYQDGYPWYDWYNWNNVDTVKVKVKPPRN